MIAGVEMTGDVLRAVCFDRFDAGKASPQVFEVPLRQSSASDTDAVAGLARALDELRQKAGLSKGRVAVAIPSTTCLFRVASFPYRSASRIAGTLGYALEDRLPGSLADYVIEPLSDAADVGDTGSSLVAAACPAVEVRRILELFQNAGLDPCIIQPTAVGLLRYVASKETTFGNEPILIARIDAGVCELVWVERGQLRACLSIPLREEEGVAPCDSDLLADRIAFAVRAYCASDGSVDFDRVVIVEASGTRDGLSAALTARLDAPVSVCESPALEGRWAAAWGVAAEAATRKHAAPTLRHGQDAYRPFALHTERRIAVALVLCIAIIGMLGFRTMRSISSVNRDLASHADRQSVLFQKMGAASGSMYDVDAILAHAREAAQDADRNRMISCIERWRALKALAPAMGQMTFEKIEINQSRVRVAVIARDASVARAFLNRIAASETFVPDPLFDQRSVSGKGVSLTMELRYR